jgi:hypothetical protein
MTKEVSFNKRQSHLHIETNSDLDEIPIAVLLAGKEDGIDLSTVKRKSYQASKRNSKQKKRESHRKSYVPPGYSAPVNTNRHSVHKATSPTGNKFLSAQQVSKRSSFQSNISSNSNGSSNKSVGSEKTLVSLEGGSFNTRISRGTKINAHLIDAPSYFISAEILSAWRGAALFVSLAFVIWGLVFERELYFNTLYGWQWLLMTIYYTV